MLTEESDIEEVKKFETVHAQTRLSKMMRIEWLGQTLASLFLDYQRICLWRTRRTRRLVTTDGGIFLDAV